MKTSTLLFPTLFLLFFLSSCGSDDDLVPTTDCGDKLICWSSTLLDSDKTLQVLSFDKPLPDSATPAIIGSLNSFEVERSIFPTNNAIYDESSKQLVGIISRERKLIRFQTDSGTSSATNLATTITAPLFLNGQCYGIEVGNEGYASGGTATFNILQIDLLTGLYMNGLTLSSNNFNYVSFFNHESMSAATDGKDELYYLSGTNLIHVTASTGDVEAFDLFPNFDSNNNFARFYGLEFKSDKSLLAIKEEFNASGKVLELIEINLDGNSPQVFTLFDIGSNIPPFSNWAINSESYSTAYDSCKDIYYITSRETISNPVTSKLIRINLNDNSIHQQVFNDYLFGINLMK